MLLAINKQACEQARCHVCRCARVESCSLVNFNKIQLHQSHESCLALYLIPNCHQLFNHTVNEISLGRLEWKQGWNWEMSEAETQTAAVSHWFPISPEVGAQAISFPLNGTFVFSPFRLPPTPHKCVYVWSGAGLPATPPLPPSAKLQKDL